MLTPHLTPLLALSADLMAARARTDCHGDYVDHDSCEWYHGTWQYLRLMDMVSSPSWHHEFYTAALDSALSQFAAPRLLISATADYSMYACVLDAQERSKKNSGRYGR